MRGRRRWLFRRRRVRGLGRGLWGRLEGGQVRDLGRLGEKRPSSVAGRIVGSAGGFEEAIEFLAVGDGE